MHCDRVVGVEGKIKSSFERLCVGLRGNLYLAGVVLLVLVGICNLVTNILVAWILKAGG